MFFNGKFSLVKLGENIEVIRGVSFKPTDVSDENDSNSCIILRSNNIDKGQINYEDLIYVTPERVTERQQLMEGDIVMCASNGSKNLVGKAAKVKNLPGKKMSFGAFCLGIRCTKSILPEFLSTYFQTSKYRDEIEALGSGSNILNIKPDHILNLEIPLPSVEVQSEFCKIVHQADKSKLV